jgi:S-adenosylmethionine-dependent methyltransferase
MTFDQHLAQWRSWAETPWGRLRFAVVRETLRRQVKDLGDAPLRVLDVGGGDGRDSIPLAEDGHLVTIVDPSGAMLAGADDAARRAGVEARTNLVHGSITDLTTVDGGAYDLVLCHFVLQYRPAGLDDLRALAASLGEQGRLSVVAPNPAGATLRRLVQDGPRGALEELERAVQRTVTFDQEVRKITDTAMCADLAQVGLEVVSQYGGRCANDLVVDDALEHDAEFYEDLLRLELALCDREPYNRIGQFWQIVARRP